MADYIDREELLKEIKAYRRNGYSSYSNDLILDIINSQPVIEQKHGHWKQFKDYANFGYSCCSCCGKKYSLPQLTYKYCPECGAKMDEVTE